MAIFIHDEGEQVRFAVVGNLSEADLAELEHSVRTAESIWKPRRLAIDLRLTSGTVPAAVEFLLSVHNQGAVFWVPGSAEPKSLSQRELQEIADQEIADDVQPEAGSSSRRSKYVARSRSVLLVALLAVAVWLLLRG